MSVGYFCVIRYLIIMLLKNNKQENKKLQYLKFLKMNCDELMQNYPISRSDAQKILWLTDILARLSRINILCLFFLTLFIHFQVLEAAKNSLSIAAFLFVTIPNFFLFWIGALSGWFF